MIFRQGVCMYELDSGWPYNYWIPIFIPLTHENKVDILLCISQLYSIVKVVHLAKVIYIFHIILPDYSHILIGGNFYFEITCWLTLMFSMYECTLCIHVNKNCIGRRFFFLFIFSRCPQGLTVDIEGTAIQDTTCKRSPSSSVPTTPTSSSADTGKALIWFY